VRGRSIYYRCRALEAYSTGIEEPVKMTARTVLIADAALAVLGRDGGRGLTHRAVDTQAGIASGSTSYYCRRRIDLLRLAEQRLLELDSQDLAGVAEALVAETATPRRVSEAIADLLSAWLSPPKRARSLARYVLFLEAAREPDLHETMAGHLELFLQLAKRVGSNSRPRLPRGRAVPTMLLAEGIMMTSLRTGSPPPGRRSLSRMLLSSLTMDDSRSAGAHPDEGSGARARQRTS
jgi:DNA-binding transcriptional regulator YbjK